MAIIKCKECGGNVSEKAETCPHCGAPVKEMLASIEREKQEEEARRKEEIEKREAKAKALGKKPWIALAALIILAVAGFAYYQANRDKEAPKFSGIEEGQIIDIKSGTAFNLKDYLKENLKVQDNKDGEIADYTITVDEKAYDSESGDVNTMQSGEFDVKIDATDKAENTSSISCKLNITPIHITKDDTNQVVYDGEYGTITLTDFKHGSINGEVEYAIDYEFSNKTDNILEMFMSSTFTYINDHQISAYVELPDTVAGGKTKTLHCSVLDKEIPDDAGEFNAIESAVCLALEDADGTEDHLIRVPIILDIDAAEQV